MAGTAAERGNRPPAESSVHEEFHATVAQVDKVLALAQTHLVDKFPGMSGATFRDPEDGRAWYFNISGRDASGQINRLGFATTTDSDNRTNHPELFQLSAIRAGHGEPLTGAEHRDMMNRDEANQKTDLQKAIEAEAEMRRILGLGTDEEEAAKTEAAERNLKRVFVEVFARAGLTFDESNEYADIAWDMHKQQLARGIDSTRVRVGQEVPEEEQMPELTEEERARQERSEIIIDSLLADRAFRRELATGERQIAEERTFSNEVGRADIPKLPLRRRPTAGRKLDSE